jgi:hypothetical protein
MKNKRVYTHSKPVIYILKSDSIFLIKIGRTKDINNRLKQLNTQTAGPGDWRVIALYESDDPVAEEAKAHKCLHNRRVCRNREFFRIQTGPAVAQLNNILRRNPEFNEK